MINFGWCFTKSDQALVEGMKQTRDEIQKRTFVY